jgi:hypothetical protein
MGSRLRELSDRQGRREGANQAGNAVARVHHMSTQHSTSAEASAVRPRRGFHIPVGVFAGLLVGAFLLGLLPMWWTAQTRAQERDAAAQELAAVQREHLLATAALLAREGEYEPAREAASRFFTEVSRELGEMQSGGESVAGADALRASLTDRDEIITLLARSDPASADRLADLYMGYRAAQPRAVAQQK